MTGPINIGTAFMENIKPVRIPSSAIRPPSCVTSAQQLPISAIHIPFICPNPQSPMIVPGTPVTAVDQNTERTIAMPAPAKAKVGNTPRRSAMGPATRRPVIDPLCRMATAYDAMWEGRL